MWSYFLRLHSSLAAAFSTDCRQSRRRLGAPTSRLLQRSTCDVTKAATAALARQRFDAAFQETKLTEAATDGPGHVVFYDGLGRGGDSAPVADPGLSAEA